MDTSTLLLTSSYVASMERLDLVQGQMVSGGTVILERKVLAMIPMVMIRSATTMIWLADHCLGSSERAPRLTHTILGKRRTGMHSPGIRDRLLHLAASLMLNSGGQVTMYQIRRSPLIER